MDQFDRAQELEMAEREAAIARQRARFAPCPSVPEVDTALDCLECGEEIAAARRIAVPGTMLCAECKEFFEQRQKRGFA